MIKKLGWHKPREMNKHKGSGMLKQQRKESEKTIKVKSSALVPLYPVVFTFLHVNILQH
jgi:hypothetical protein